MAETLIIPESQQLPENFCPESWQQVLDQFAADMRVRLPEGEVEFTKGQNEPTTGDDNLVWIKTDENNRILGFYTYVNGVWTEAKQRNFYHEDIGVKNLVRIDTGEGFISPADVLGRPFIVKVKAGNTNDSVVKFKLDLAPERPLFKKGNSELESGDIKEGQLLLIISDGTNYQLVTTIPQKVIKFVSNTGVQNLPVPGATTTFAHTFGQPPFARIMLRAKNSMVGTNGYDVNDLASPEAFQAFGGSASGSPIPTFHVSADSSNIYVRMVSRCSNSGQTPVTQYLVQPKSSDMNIVDMNPNDWSLVVYAELPREE
jgi:hypothetical protein